LPGEGAGSLDALNGTPVIYGDLTVKDEEPDRIPK
jgi:hypothetical protein